VKLEARFEPGRFGWGKGFVKRSRAMRVKIVLHEYDAFGLGEVFVGQRPQEVGVIPAGAPFSGLKITPA